MATYLDLPPVSVTATQDTTGRNGTNWTNYFSSSVLGALKMPVFELYHATVTNAPSGAGATLARLSGYVWGFTAPGQGQGAEYHLGGSGWIMRPGQEFAVFWTAAATGVAPVFTAWFRYDLDIPANARAAR